MADDYTAIGRTATGRAAASRADSSRADYEVLIVGAGIAGIGVAIELKKHGIESFILLERAAEVGGTWRDNRYPGVAVDITSFTYSYSFEQKPDWSRVFAPGSELQTYVRSVATKYAIYPKTRFGVEVQEARFDEDRHLWRVRLTNGEQLSGRYLVGATGGLITPKMPDIPGLDSFAGKLIHTARWDDSYDLKGKRVAVIGTGATAVQLVPAIAPQLAHLDVYQRTPIWLLKKPDAEVPHWIKAAFTALPLTQRLLRTATDAATETVMVCGALYYRQAPWIIRWAERACKQNLLEQVPNDPALREKLTPHYDFGCKRPSFSNEYFRSFTRDNVDLITDPIECITPEGVRTKDGVLRPVDVLITATGYRVFEKGNIPSFLVYGRGGRELGEFWDQNRYQAYEGVSVPGFPNYFLTLGPYSFTATSYFKTVEGAATHIVRCIREAHDKSADCVEIRQQAHDRYFETIQRRQRSTVFLGANCAGSNSYYFDKHGDAPMLRPMTSFEALWRARHFPLTDYRFTALPPEAAVPANRARRGERIHPAQTAGADVPSAV